jgi:tetratricopeptide (TPR) repeat protein
MGREFGDGTARMETMPVDLPGLLVRNRLLYASMFTRTVFEEAGGYRDDPRGYEDWDFWIACMACGGRFRHLPRELLFYRKHGPSMLQEADSRSLLLRSQIVLNHPTLFSPERVRTARRIVELGDAEPDLDLRVAITRILVEDGYLVEALPHVEAILASSELEANRSASLHSIRGLALMEQRRPQDAIEALRVASRLEPWNAAHHRHLAAAWHKQGQDDVAIGHLGDALEIDPQNREARSLLRRVAPDRPPYIAMYPGAENPHGRFAMLPLLRSIEQQGRMEATLLGEERLGVQEARFALAHAVFARRPDVLVVFRSWWGEEREVALAARRLGIPVVMINHGAMFIRNDDQVYKRTLFPADVNCIWGQRDLDLWRTWNQRDRFVVTGNPCFDQLQDFKPSDLDLPDSFALCLTPGGGPDFQREVLLPSIRALHETLPVVVKCHPRDESVAELRREFRTFGNEPEVLFTLLHQCTCVVSNVTSALLPALLWQKPVFLHSYAEPGYDFNEFRERYRDVFNFKSDARWGSGFLEEAVRPRLDHYEHFAHRADGNNTRRVLDVIEEYAQVSTTRAAFPELHFEVVS